MTIYVVDVETTGLDPDHDRVVELAVVSVFENRREYGAPIYNSLVIPGIPIPAAASAIHHIVDADIENGEAVTFNYAVSVVYSCDHAGVLAAHNAAFDSAFMPSDGKWICTMRVAKHLWPDAPGYGNQVLRYWLDLPVDSDCVPHRALGDAEVTAQLLLKELALVDGSVERLLELTETPVLLKTVSFGKHRGQLWKDVPKDYLEWAVTTAWDDPDVAHTIKLYL